MIESGGFLKKRVFLVVLDSFGIGAMPDAAAFGDVGANTLRSVARSAQFDVPTMRAMGLFNIEGVDCMPGVVAPSACYARLAEQSNGKDTTVGHWELAGVRSPHPLPTYPNGFPAEVIAAFEVKTGRHVLCNQPCSGTEVIRHYGEAHMRTGDLIVYTSADSVFQIAAHEEIVPVSELYAICQTARDLLTQSGTHAVGRVIARPFAGTSKDNFMRTPNRHDFSLEPPRETLLDRLAQAGYDTIGVGKIYDIFAGRGVTERIQTKNNADGMRVIDTLISRDFSGLAFINLVDFDMLYGHRNDVDGYAAALTVFDRWLTTFLPKLRSDDLLILTADHGCDPGFVQSTDHSREYVPMLAYKRGARGCDLGTRSSFSDVAATIRDYFTVSFAAQGESFLNSIRQ